MSKSSRLHAFVLCLLMVGIVGCGPKQPAAAPKAESKPNEGPVLSPPQKQSAESEPSDKSAAGEIAEAAKIKASLASLSVEDRAIAEKQKICPVSGEPLGTMGPPKKVSVAGHDVFICCEGCEKPITSEPDKYLAKLGLEPKK